MNKKNNKKWSTVLSFNDLISGIVQRLILLINER